MKDPFWKRGKKDIGSEEAQDGEKSFAQKIGSFFSTEPQKEKVLRHEDFNAAGDVYYATVSAGYKIAQRILWLFFVFFMVISIVANFSSITYDNFYYLIKDFSSAADTESNDYETLSYESDPRQYFALYRGGLATVSPSKISVFTATGRRSLNDTSSFSSPYIASSDRYMLVYDTSGTTFSIYNSFARVYTETLDYPVNNACFADDGSFVIITRSADSRSIVCRYDSKFERRSEIRSDAYIFDVVADSDRGFVALMSYEAGNGTGRTVLSVRNSDDMEEVEKLELDGEFPLSCGFLQNDRFAIITDTYVRILDSTFDEIERSAPYMGGNITGFALSEQGAAVSFISSSKSNIIAFDSSGAMLYEDTVDVNVSDVAVYGSYVFLQNEQGVYRIDPDEPNETEKLVCGDGKMLIYNDQTVLVCGESKAEYLIFGNN